jgi:hypothetical protein
MGLVTCTPPSHNKLKTSLALATKGAKIAFADVAIKEAAIQSIRFVIKKNAEKKKTKDQRHLNKARVIDHETAGEILADLALKDAKREAAKLAQDHQASKKASKNSFKKCLRGSSKAVSIAEEVETFYYDASEGCSGFEVMMEVESDFSHKQATHNQVS